MITYDADAPWMALVNTKEHTFTCVIDNILPGRFTDQDKLNIYDIDMLHSDTSKFFDIATQWYEEGHKIPLSIYLSQHGLSHKYNYCYKTISTSTIKQTIGPVFIYYFKNHNITKTRTIALINNRNTGTVYNNRINTEWGDK